MSDIRNDRPKAVPEETLEANWLRTFGAAKPEHDRLNDGAVCGNERRGWYLAGKLREIARSFKREMSDPALAHLSEAADLLEGRGVWRP